MIFGTREKEYELGSFTSDACSACKKGKTYTFIKAIRFIVVFFINLIPLGARYEAVCENCGDIVKVDKKAGAGIARTRFSTENNAVSFFAVMKLALLAVVIALAVVLPLLLVPQAAPAAEDLKALVSEDGQFGIQNAKGEVYGYVSMQDGQKTVTFYTETIALIGEPGASGMMMKQNFEEASDEDGNTAMERILTDVGSLRDRYDTKVRTYHYDVVSDSLGYALGVADLTAIQYSAGKVVYPFTQYSENGQSVQFLLVKHIAESQHVAATFEPTSAGSDVLYINKVLVSDYEDGRQVSESLYSVSSTPDDIQVLNPLDQNSTAADILAYLELTGQQPLYSETYVYYKNTQVMTEITAMIADAQGMMQASTRYIDVWEKNGYYITTEGSA